jgi:chromosomal replication initiator protein
MSNEELWQAVLGEMELSLSKAQFITWFKNTAILSNQNGKVTIGVPNGFAKEWLENKFNLHILQSLRRFQGDIQEISCVLSAENPISSQLSPTNESQDQPKKASVPQDDREMVTVPAFFPKAPVSEAKQIPGSTQVFRPVSPSSALSITPSVPASTPPAPAPVTYRTPQNAQLNPRYTFENFVVGENNELARAACYAVSQNLGRMYNPLFIYGGVGLGKTHLLQSIGNEILRKSPEKRVKYITSERFTSELVESIKNQKVAEFKEAYQKVDLLIIDDVQFLSGREKTQDEFFHIFNTLYQVNKQIVISSDRPPQAIPTLEDRLRSRFQGGMIADISRPDLETRMAILRIKLAEKHFFLDDESIRFMAENVNSNIRELEGALNRVVASCEFHKVPPSVAYTRKILGDFIATTRKTAHPENILKAVAEFYGIDESALVNKGRKKEIAHPRQVAMYLMRTELQVSFAAIGKQFGGRDHTTTLHAFEKIQKDLEHNVRLKEELNSLKERLYRH